MARLSFVLQLLCAAQCRGDLPGDAFAAFVQRHGRSYEPGSAEHGLRRGLFMQRAAEVEAINSRPRGSWRATLNKFSDWTEPELRQLRGWRGGARPSRGGRAAGAVQRHVSLRQTGRLRVSRSEALPEAVDWGNLTKTREPLDQGSCGSCWAISAARTLDMHLEIRGLLRGDFFSVQELVNCVPNPHHCGGTGGCEGATAEMAFAYALKYGLRSTKQVPYQARTGRCTTSLLSGRGHRDNGADTLGVGGTELLVPLEGSKSVGVFAAESNFAGPLQGILAWERLPENEDEPLMWAVAQRGPVTVSVGAANWYFYLSGVFDFCPLDAVIDHAVVLIGYGAAGGKMYWIVRNSWGPGWGESGNIRLLRTENEGQHCGTDRQPEVGTGCDNGPTEVTVCGSCGILYDSVVPHVGKPLETPL